VKVVTWYLEQADPSDLRPAGPPPEPVAIERAEIPSPELNRFLYASVGGHWYWVDRVIWTWQRWQEWLERPGVETWVARVRGTPAGYVELAGDGSGEVEIASFGLLPAFIGRGIGGHLLSVGLARAWSLAERWPGVEPTHRVWVHTCSLDGPHALANYKARGLQVYDTRVKTKQVASEPPGPWPGAARPRNEA
jgi:GNAT superfamily N-acetyltransferase